MNEFNINWLNLVLEYKDNPDVTFDLSQNDVRILLTYIEVLQSKIDKAIEYLSKNNVSLNELTKDFKIIPTNMIMIEFLKGERKDILKEDK